MSVPREGDAKELDRNPGMLLVATMKRTIAAKLRRLRRPGLSLLAQGLDDPLTFAKVEGKDE
jgi:hypothetical protein